MKFLSLYLFLSLTHAWSADDTPNIVFVLVDDMGYGDLASHGNPLIHTPQMDRIHHESVRFTNFCVSPSCAPTRATLMSGKHEFKVDVSHTILGSQYFKSVGADGGQCLAIEGLHDGYVWKNRRSAARDHPENGRLLPTMVDGFLEALILNSVPRAETLSFLLDQ